ncbi:hypothetical protein C8R47DRAFT_1247409 [Mycena vitilis]|nr:hypothetical protein C8R47DRAFT_1247409 [Mycena vitilis]
MALFLVLVSLGSVLAQTGSPSAPTATTLNPPAQPTSTGLVGGFEIIGNSLVSAQQLFLGTPDKVFVLDKVENNAASINGHPAWVSEYAVGANTARTMDAVTNTFGGAQGEIVFFSVYLSQAAFHKFEDQLRARDVEEQKGLHRRHSALLRPCAASLQFPYHIPYHNTFPYDIIWLRTACHITTRALSRPCGRRLSPPEA